MRMHDPSLDLQQQLRRQSETLRKMTAAALAVSRAEGEGLFGSLACELAALLEVDATMIAVRTDFGSQAPITEGRGRMRTLATWLDGRLLRKFEYELQDTPCRYVIGSDARFVASGMHAEFGRGTMFSALGFDAYAARSLVDHHGRQIGLIVAMNRKPLVDRELTEALLHIFSVRAAAEIQRRHDEQELRRNESDYRAIFDAAEDAIFVHDWDTGAILDVSSKASALYGLTREEFLKARVAEFSANVPPYTEADAMRHIQRAKVHSGPWRFEWRGRHRDGRLMWHEVTLKRAEIGGEPRVLAFVRDVTERKAAEDALRASEEQHRVIFDGSADALALWDREMRIVDVNRAFTQIYGYGREEVVGATFGHRIPREAIARRKEMIELALAGKECQFESVGVRKNGERFDVELRYLPVMHLGEPHVLAVGRDITERKRAEQALRASEEQYRSIFNASADALVLRDAEFRIVDVNATYETMSGYTHDEVVGIDRVIANPPEVRAEIVALHRRALAGEQITLETQFYRRDGTRYELELRGVPILHRGEPHVLYMGRNVTARKLAEQALRDSEEQYRAIFNASADGLFLRDAEFRIVDVNPAYVALKGFAREELIGTTAIISPSAHEESERRAEHARALAGETIRFETAALRKDGSWCDVEVRGMPLQYRGAPHVLYSVRDITERKNAERALRDSEEQYRAIFNASADALTLRDAEFRIVDVNPAYTELSGYSREEALGSSTVLSLSVNDSMEIRAQRHARALSGEAVRYESTGTTKDGRRFDAEVRGRLVMYRGAPHVLYIARDITERKLAEQALRDREEQYRAIFNASADALVLRHADFHIVDVNPAYTAMYGYTREEALGATYVLTQESDAESEMRRHQHARALAGEMLHYERTGFRKDGTRFVTEVRGMPVVYLGQPHVLYVARDITARLEAEEALRVSEEQYRAIFNGSADALVLHDADGIVVDVNPAFLELYGYRREQIIGGVHPAHLPADIVAQRREHIRRALSGERLHLETRAVRNNGEHFDIEARIIPISHRGRPHALAIVRDITQRRRAEEALRSSEEQYRAIFNASVDGLLLWDAEHRIVDVNDAFVTLHGFTRDALLGQDAPIFIPADLQAECAKLLPEILAGKPCHINARSRRSDGTEFDAEIHGVPMLYQGRPHILVILRDITEAKRAERALRASEERYRLLFETESDAIVVVDADTLALMDANQAAIDMYGYSRDQIKRLTACDLSVESEATAASIQRPMGAVSIPLRLHRRSDGTVFPVEIKANRLQLEGRTTVVAAIRDISERRNREEALRRSEAQLRATVDAAFDCVIGMDREGRVIEFNTAAERCFGYTRDQVLGRVLADAIIPMQHRRAHARGMENYLQTGQGAYIGRRIETTAVRADGTEFPIELAIRVSPSADGEIFIGYLRDLTESKRIAVQRAELEQQLRQAQRMETIGQLTGGIAHDFNNILASIMGYVTLAQDRPQAAADLKLVDYLEQARQAGRRARDLIQQMLAFSRGRRGEMQPVQLAPLVDESLRLLRATLPSGCQLVVEHEDSSVIAQADAVQLQQVLLNLGINARDAMRGNGRIGFGLRGPAHQESVCASCGKAVNGVFSEIWISDTGPGIEPAARRQIFEPFFSTKAPGHGTGMGLATVHRVVHEHGGHVIVGNGDVGARFAILLPRASEQQPVALAAPSSGLDLRPPLRGRVLLVDDEESVLGFMRELLQNWGLEVTATRAPLEARTKFTADPERFDLLLTDQTMPGLSGIELIEAVRAVHPTLPVLLYSGNADAIDPTRLKAAAVAHVMHKPVEPAELRSAIEACLTPVPTAALG